VTRQYREDITCFGRMDQIAEGAAPALCLDPPGRPVERTTGVHMTETGPQSLAGEVDQIAPQRHRLVDP
jgi:hypothetical protein